MKNEKSKETEKEDSISEKVATESNPKSLVLVETHTDVGLTSEISLKTLKDLEEDLSYIKPLDELHLIADGNIIKEDGTIIYYEIEEQEQSIELARQLQRLQENIPKAILDILRQEAIKWIKDLKFTPFYKRTDEFKNLSNNEIVAIINWIKYFFNISEDLK